MRHKHHRHCTDGLDPLGKLLHYLPERPDGACWLWDGPIHNTGYGVVKIDGKQARAHRLAYETWVGPIPDGLTIDHVRARGCISRACCNPAHLEAVTMRENLLRSDSPFAQNFRKTECINGHPYTPENTRVDTDSRGRTRRTCRECTRAAGRRNDLNRRHRRRDRNQSEH